MFSTKPYDRHALDEANVRHRHELVYFEPRLSLQTPLTPADSKRSAPS